MLNTLFIPFSSMPATTHHDPKSPSELKCFTLFYNEEKLNVRVEEADDSDKIEIEIEGFNCVFGPHMVGKEKNRWAIEFGSDRSVHTASIVNDHYLLFDEIPNEGEAKEVLRLIDLIIQANKRHGLMIKDFVDKYREALRCEWHDETSSLHIYGRRGNVSVYNTSNQVLVYIQSDDESRIFKPYLAREFAPTPEKDPSPSYVLSYDGKHFPGAEYVEDEIYVFSFDLSCDEAQVRMLVDAVVDVLKRVKVRKTRQDGQ